MARSKPVVAPAKAGASKQLPDLRLNALASRLTSFQRELVDAFWKYHREHGKWMPTRLVHSRIGTQKVRDALQPLGGDVVRELENPPNDTYELSSIGILMTSEGENYRRLLVRYLEFLRDQFVHRPEQLDFTHKEIQEELSLSDGETALLGKLIQLGHSFGAASWGETFWTIRVPKEVEYLPMGIPLDAALDEWLFRHFQQRPVFAAEARRQWSRRAMLADTLDQSQPSPMAIVSSIDALKKRYQVFVSSTYEDLKEERQHVIQALLETKCIPLGMELFPAASIEQWELIKRVIDECDYYIVIVAGRYGSLNDAQIGYTEMEFDYALSIGKSVIGFYHKNPDALPLSKSEKTDAGRERLKHFTDKVKKRVCRAWASSAELGSGVKSAILNELEFNPKPGWVRADAIPSSEQVEKLKQRIADLEERLKKSRQDVLPTKLETNTCLHFKVSMVVKKTKTQTVDIEVSFTSDELFVVCAQFFQATRGWSEELRKVFPQQFQHKLEAAVMAQYPQARLIRAEISREEFEDVIHAFVAEKLLKATNHGWTDAYGAWLKLTEKGLHRLSSTKVRLRHAAI